MTPEQEKFWAERIHYIKILFLSARDGDLEMVKYLVEKKNIDPDSTCDDYEIPLHIAIKKRHTDIAKYLIDHGAGVNNANPSNETPLYFARRTENGEILKYLLDHDAQPLIQTNDLDFPFNTIIEGKLSEMAIKLMRENLAKNLW